MQTQAACPDCGRTGLKLSPDGLYPRHKPPRHTEWPNPNAARPNGWCKGTGRWVGDTNPASAL